MLARVHALSGIVPLGAYLVYHLYQTWPVLEGREAWLDRVLSSPSRWVVAGWVLLPLVLHAVLGAVRLRREPHRPLTGPPALRALQAATGVLALAFVLFHVQQVWSVSAGPHASPHDAYAVLFHALGRPFDAAVYVIGVTALCFHLGHGLSRAAATFGLARSPLAVRNARALSGLLGGVVWLLFMQLFGHLAAGEALFPYPR